MIIKFEQNETQEEIEVCVRYKETTKELTTLKQMLETFDSKVKCKSQEEAIWLSASEIFYIESVDKRTFIYGERMVYESSKRLYQLEKELPEKTFVRVSKACIVNIEKLKSIRTLVNSRLEATLINEEKITITRKYIAGIRRKLEDR